MANAKDNVNLVAFMTLLENKDKDPEAIRAFVDQAGLEKKYPLGFALFYSDGRRQPLYYVGSPSSSGISFDPSILKVTQKDNWYCLNFLPVRINGNILYNIQDTCFSGHGIIHAARVLDVDIDIEPLAISSEGAAWVLGMKPTR